MLSTAFVKFLAALQRKSKSVHQHNKVTRVVRLLAMLELTQLSHSRMMTLDSVST